MKKEKLKAILYFFCMFYLFFLVFFALFVVGKLFVVNINPCFKYFPNSLKENKKNYISKNNILLNSTKIISVFQMHLENFLHLLKDLNYKLVNIDNKLSNFDNKTIKLFVNCNTTCVCLNNFNSSKEKNNKIIKKAKRKLIENKEKLHIKNYINNSTSFPSQKIIKIKIIKFYDDNDP